MLNCYRCERSNYCTPVPPRIVAGAKFCIAGNTPYYLDENTGYPFSDSSGRFVREVLDSLGIDSEHISYTNACMCSQTLKVSLTKEHFDACGRHFWRSIRMAYLSGTRYFLSMGNNVSTILTGKQIRYDDSEGKKFPLGIPADTWNAVKFEDFCNANGITVDLGLNRDGVHQKYIFTKEFLGSSAFAEATAKGFQFDTVPTDAFVYVLQNSTQYEKLGFDGRARLSNKLTRILNDINGIKMEVHKKDYKGIFRADEAIDYINFIIDSYKSGKIPYVSYDLETVGPIGNEEEGGLQPFLPGGKVLTVNLSHKAHFARVIYLGHFETEMTVSEQSAVARKVCEMLAIVPIAGANIKFDIHWSRFKLGAKKWIIAHDTQMLSYTHILGVGNNGLKDLTSSYLDEDSGYEDELKNILESMPKGKKHYGVIPSSVMTKYAGHDVDSVLQLIPILVKRLEYNKQYENYKTFLIHPYNAFINIEQNGAHIDRGAVDSLIPEYQKKMSSTLERFMTDPEFADVLSDWVRYKVNNVRKVRLKKYKTQARRDAPITEKDIEINFGSSEQVAILLFSIMKLKYDGKPGKKKTDEFPDGVPSTDNETLEGLSEKVYRDNPVAHKLVSMLIESRLDTKVFSTYLEKAYDHCPVPDGKPDWWDTRQTLNDSRAYEAELYDTLCQSPSFNLTSTDTGRTSCSSPNIQQVTSKMRKLYIPRTIQSGELESLGFDPKLNIRRLIANFDVGQAELRMLASASGDPIMISIMSDPKRDIHREIASVAYNKPLLSITKDERGAAKSVVFGIIYGESMGSIAARLLISEDEANTIKSAIFRLMPMAGKFIQAKELESDTEVGGQFGIWTPTGRYRSLDAFKRDEGMRHRRAVNTPIQGAASDLTLYAVGMLYNWAEEYKVKSKLWNFVHDSINLDVYPQEIEMLMGMCRYFFSTCVPQKFQWYKVPLVLEFEFGIDWMRQVKCDYNETARTIKLKGPSKDLLPVLEVFDPLVTLTGFNDTWSTDIIDTNNEVWVTAKFN